MNVERRRQQLQRDHELLEKLRQASSILDFQPFGGEPPERYTVVFRGKGLTRDPSSDADVRVLDEHRVELRLPYAYPDVPPDLRWITAIFHPNVSFSGFIRLRDVGILWDQPVGLDVVCERLWDVARLAYANLDEATNYQARNWLQRQQKWTLPVDPRQIRDRAAPAQEDVIAYRRTQTGDVELLGPQQADEVLYIGDDTPAPPPPAPPRPRRSPRPQNPSDDQDVFYIGDD